jgi:quercetin dioxygenase-like cupin family protein
MSDIIEGHYKDLKLKIQGLVPAGQDLHRQVLFDQLYSSIPKDPKARVQVYTAEIVPMGWTNFHCHNGATFFLALQGIFEAHFEEGILIRAKAGDVYSEPIGKMHRGHNPHNTIPYLCVGFCITASDRPHVTMFSRRTRDNPLGRVRLLCPRGAAEPSGPPNAGQAWSGADGGGLLRRLKA